MMVQRFVAIGECMIEMSGGLGDKWKMALQAVVSIAKGLQEPVWSEVDRW